jgi:hypothetical protein
MDTVLLFTGTTTRTVHYVVQIHNHDILLAHVQNVIGTKSRCINIITTLELQDNTAYINYTCQSFYIMYNIIQLVAHTRTTHARTYTHTHTIVLYSLRNIKLV